jgi:hypothetical protein
MLALALGSTGLARGAIRISVEEPRGRSALVAVDGTTARTVAPDRAWQHILSDPGHQDISLVELAAQGGRSAALVNHDPSPAGKVELVQVLSDRLEPGTGYTVSLQARGRVLAEGEAQVYVEGRAPGGEWEELLRSVLDVTGQWLDTSGQFRAREGHQEIRVGVRVRGRGSLKVDDVRLTALGSDENLLTDGGFEDGAYWRVAHRLQASGAEWTADPAVIREGSYRLLGLSPNQRYEARATLHSATGSVLEESPVVEFGTLDSDTIRTGGATVSEAVALGGPGLSSPCLIGVGGGALLIASHGGGVYSHPIGPGGEIGQPSQLAPAVLIDESPAPVDGIRGCIAGDRLVVTYRVALGPEPRDQSLRVLAQNLRTGEVTGPRSIRAGEALWSARSAAPVEAWDTLWVLYAEALDAPADERVRLKLRPLDPRTLEPLGEDTLVTGTPSEQLADPALATLHGQLALAYVDRGGMETDAAGRQPTPIYLQTFDGRQFGEPVPLAVDAVAGQPQATTAGDGLMITWRQAVGAGRTAGGEPLFWQTAVARVRALGAAETIPLPADNVYVSSPSSAAVGDGLLVIERRWEHLPGIPGDPALDLGLWAMRVEP